MANYAMMIDFGSTYTKIVCASLTEKRLIRAGSFPSTVRSDARVNLEQCMEFARETLGKENLEQSLKLCSSSAAGGLRMAVIGLTERLSYVAGRNTAFGAGGKIIASYSGALTPEQIHELELSQAEIILLCGGYEKGNRSIVMHNAEMLANSHIFIPVIYAGNSSIARQVRTALVSREKKCLLADNIIPDVGVLNTASAEEAIRDQFMNRIVNMKGIGCVRSELGEVLMPTPAAVLAAGTLLSEGSATQKGLGKLMMVDVGGATTDVYSFNENKPYPGARLMGVSEPYAKRTVEGDMGMRESSICILREVGDKALASGAGVTAEQIEQGVQTRITTTGYLPDTPDEQRIDQELAGQAVGVSVRRHAGHVEHVWTTGSKQYQVGKNISEVSEIIGIGGVIVNSPDPAAILQRSALRVGESEDVLIPRELNAHIDRDYVFYAAGLLRDYDEETAMALMKASIR